MLESNFAGTRVVCIDVGRDRVKESSVDAIFKANARLTSRKDGSVFEDNGCSASGLKWISKVCSNERHFFEKSMVN